LDIETYVVIVVGRYEEFKVILIDWGDRFVRGLNSPNTDVCTVLCAKMSNSLLMDAMSVADMM